MLFKGKSTLSFISNPKHLVVLTKSNIQDHHNNKSPTNPIVAISVLSCCVSGFLTTTKHHGTCRKSQSIGKIGAKCNCKALKQLQ
jgi:hypothetical protein